MNPNCVTGFVSCVFKTSASAVIVSSTNTGAVKLPFLAHEDGSRTGHVHGHQGVQETGSESALYDEPPKGCGGREVRVEMKRIAVAAEFLRIPPRAQR